jgi:hypothetical protein
MADEIALPKISGETRDKLTAHGFINHLYDSTQLPSMFVPRGSGCTSYYIKLMLTHIL